MRYLLYPLMLIFLIQHSYGIEKVPLEEEIMVIPNEESWVGGPKDKEPQDASLSVRDKASIISRPLSRAKRPLRRPKRRIFQSRSTNPTTFDKPITVDEMVATYIPEFLRKKESPISIDMKEKVDVSSIKVKQSPRGEVSKTRRNLNIAISGIGLAGLLIGLFLIGNSKRVKKRSKNDISSGPISEGWLKGDIGEVHKIKEMIQRLEERMKLEGLERMKLMERVSKIEMRINNELGPHFEDHSDSKSSQHDEIVKLAKEGFGIDEIAKMTKMGKEEVNLILKRHSNAKHEPFSQLVD